MPAPDQKVFRRRFPPQRSGHRQGVGPLSTFPLFACLQMSLESGCPRYPQSRIKGLMARFLSIHTQAFYKYIESPYHKSIRHRLDNFKKNKKVLEIDKREITPQRPCQTTHRRLLEASLNSTGNKDDSKSLLSQHAAKWTYLSGEMMVSTIPAKASMISPELGQTRSLLSTLAENVSKGPVELLISWISTFLAKRKPRREG